MKITKSDFGTLNTGENIYIYHMAVSYTHLDVYKRQA